MKRFAIVLIGLALPLAGGCSAARESTISTNEAAACKTDIKSIELSAEAIRAKTGSYPTAATDLDDASKGGLLRSVPAGYDYVSADGLSYSITPNPAVPGCKASHH